MEKKHFYLKKQDHYESSNNLTTQESAQLRRRQMLEVAKVLDKLNLGWDEEAENCVILDGEVSG